MGKYIDIFCNMECIIVFCNISDKFQLCEELKAYRNLNYNTKAIRCSSVIGFRMAGECHMYEQDFLCYEKEL